MRNACFVADVITHKPVTLVSDHCVRADSGLSTYRNAWINANSRSENRSPPDTDIGAHHAKRLDHDAIADLSISLDNCQGRDNGARRDYASGHPRRIPVLVTNEGKHLGNRRPRIADFQYETIAELARQRGTIRRDDDAIAAPGERLANSSRHRLVDEVEASVGGVVECRNAID